MMVLLNLEGTLLPSLSCKNCEQKVYNASQVVQGNMTYFEPYPVPGTNLSFNGSVVYDQICIDDKFLDNTCTPIQKEDAFSFFAIEE
jgi:hypothetical protein